MRIVDHLETWVHEASPTKLILLTIFFGVGLFGVSCGLDVVWAAYNGPTIVAMVSADALVAALSAFLLLKIMLAGRARHRRFLRQLHVVAEMNHHIRNALVAIQLSTYSTDDEKHLSSLSSAAERIEWTLREILPKSTEPERE